MFEKELAARLRALFKIQKVSYDQPGESNEQDCIFVTVDTPRIKFKDGRATARVSGKITIQGNSERIPFGYMLKAYQEADAAFKKDIAFFNLEQNEKYYRNLVQRTCDFVYFFSTQYNPNMGTIDSVDITIEET
jgi:hypothetical protein